MVYELEKEHKKSSLMCKKKEELVKEIMRLEHNVNVMNERLNNQANAIKHYEQESRNKAIDDFAEALKKEYENAVSIPNMERETAYFVINAIAEKLKGEKTMSERTVITTMEVTKIYKDVSEDFENDKTAYGNSMKDRVKKALDADDVVVTNVQEFVLGDEE